MTRLGHGLGASSICEQRLTINQMQAGAVSKSVWALFPPYALFHFLRSDVGPMGPWRAQSWSKESLLVWSLSSQAALAGARAPRNLTISPNLGVRPTRAHMRRRHKHCLTQKWSKKRWKWQTNGNVVLEKADEGEWGDKGKHTVGAKCRLSEITAEEEIFEDDA